VPLCTSWIPGLNWNCVYVGVYIVVFFCQYMCAYNDDALQMDQFPCWRKEDAHPRNKMMIQKVGKK
jgi:hypothetical protein